MEGNFMEVRRSPFGTADGRPVELFILTSAQGMEVGLTNFGASLVSWKTPDKEGRLADIVLGYDEVSGYQTYGGYLGALVGRYANRIGNAYFELNGKGYQLAKNDGENHLHGGNVGFSHRVWDVEITGSASVAFSLVSPDGEENYPGTLKVRVEYSLSDEGELRLDYNATSDQDTIVNLTNHAYFNLKGHDQGTILDHVVTINAEHYLPIDPGAIPLGGPAPVAGTPFDFRTPKAVGAEIDADDEQIKNGSGYDHNYVLNRTGSGLVKAAEVFHPETGRVLEVYTTKPGMQFYSGNHLTGGNKGKGGYIYPRRGGLCLETQFYPDSINRPSYPSPILRVGEEYRHTTVFRASVR